MTTEPSFPLLPRAPLRRGAVLLAALAAAFTAGTAAAQAAAHVHDAEDPSIPLYADALGDFSWTVTTRSPEAQAYFDQGMRLMFAFGRADARRSFAESRRLDSDCAMCWWGHAWSMGAYLNGAMDEADAAEAHATAQRARELSVSATPVERELIEALTTRYAPPDVGLSRRQQDTAYAHAMEAVHARHPNDHEVATLYVDAMMLLEPRRGTWSLEKPSVARILEVLEGVLAVDLGHPGACHLYIHATETTPKVTDAQPCADLLSAAIPGASHINHMPSHTYNRVGRWGDATRSNIEAWHSDLKARRGEGFAIYPAHNLQMLLFSAAVDGQGAVSIQAARDYARLVPADGHSFHGLVLVRFGRFAEILELTTPPTHPIHLGLWTFARGMAHLREGAADSAAHALVRVEELARETPETTMFRVHRPAQLLGVVAELLRGEMLREEGQAEDALAAFRRAVAFEDGLIYDEPEPLPFMARDYLGAMLMEMGQAEEAASVYERTLEARPHNGWSLFGLERALRAQGRVAEADDVRRRFEETWVRSDTWLYDTRY